MEQERDDGPDVMAELEAELNAAPLARLPGTALVQADKICVLLSRVEQERAALVAWMDTVKTRVAWLDEHAEQVREAFLRPVLESLSAESGKKTIPLPHGTAKLRAVAPALRVEDEAAVMAAGFARTPEPRPVVDKTKLNEHFKATGEIPPGCVVVEAHNSITLDLRRG